MPRVKEIKMNKIPRWRLIRRYENSDKVDKFIFSSLQEIAQFLGESFQNVSKFTSKNDNTCKQKYLATIKRWKYVDIQKCKYKKLITYVEDD